MSGESSESHLLFLSHAGVDSDVALALALRIETSPVAKARGLRVWVDKRDLVTGQPWQSQLEAVLAETCTAFAVYVGRTGIINWVDSEVQVALARARSEPQFAFIPILAGDDTDPLRLPPFARLYQGVVDVENDSTQFARLIDAATGRNVSDDAGAPALIAEPFLGLQAFSEADRHLFFGRDAEALELVQRLRSDALLMIVGDSGSGKSSLVKAGLVPRFRGGELAATQDDRDAVWHVVEMRPGRHPFEALADSVASSAQQLGRAHADIVTLRQAIHTQVPREISDAFYDLPGVPAQTLLVVDQFEELFTLTDAQARERFVELLLFLAGDSTSRPVFCVLTMRRDYYNLCRNYPSLYERLEDPSTLSKYSLRRMSDAALRACVEEPLALSGIKDADVFVDRVLADLGDQPGDLALLEMALTESWRRRGAHHDDLLASYIALGGVSGALANVAELAFANLDTREQDLARSALIRLVRLGETGGTTRRVAGQREFSSDAWAVLQRLASVEFGRLVFITEAQSRLGRSDASVDGGDTVELAHEALVAQWPRYQQWLQDAPERKRIHDQLVGPAAHWEAATTRRTKSDALWAGPRLSQALGLLRDQRSWLSQTEIGFLESAARKERMHAAVRWIGVASLVGLAVLAVWSAYRAGEERTRAQAAEQAMAHQLVRTHWIQGVRARDENAAPLRAAHYFARAGTRASEARERAHASMALNAVAGRARLQAMLSHDGLLRGVRMTGDGATVLTWGDDATARIWDGESGAPIGPPMQHDDVVLGADFDPSEARAATWSRDGAVRLWDLRSGERIAGELRHDAEVLGASFGPNGQRLISWSADGTARLWNSHSPGAVTILRHDSPVLGALFHGRRVVTWSARSEVRVWDASTGARLGAALKHSVEIGSPDINPDHNLLVTWFAKAVQLTRLDSGAPAGSLVHSQVVRGAKVSPDGTSIVSWTHGDSARLWDIGTAAPVGDALRHHGGIVGAVFGKGGRSVMTWSTDGEVRVWDRGTGALAFPPLAHDGAMRGAEFLESTRRIITWSYDATVRVWHRDTGEPVAPPLVHSAGIRSVVTNRDETLLMAFTATNEARVWDLRTGRAVTLPLLQGAKIRGGEFSSSGRSLLTWGEDKSAKLWTLNDPHLRLTKVAERDELSAAVATAGNRGMLLWGQDLVAWYAHDASAEYSPIALPPGFAVRGAALAGDGERIVLWSDASVLVWDRPNKRFFPRLEHEFTDGGQPARRVRGAALSDDGARVVTWDQNHRVRTWQVESGSMLSDAISHGAAIRGATFDRSGDRLLTWSKDYSARVWGVMDGIAVTEPLLHKADVVGATFSPTAKQVLTWSYDDTARLWSLPTGDALGEPFRHADLVRGAAFSPDEKYIVTWSFDHTARLWLAATGESLGEALKHEDAVLGATFDATGERLLTWNQGPVVRVWNVLTRQLAAPPMRQRSFIKGAFFLTATDRVATWDKSRARIWNARTGEAITPALEHPAPLLNLMTNADETQIISVAGDGVVRRWMLGDDSGEVRSDFVTRLESATGTRLSASDEIEVLTASQWRAARERTGTDGGVER